MYLKYHKLQNANQKKNIEVFRTKWTFGAYIFRYKQSSCTSWKEFPKLFLWRWRLDWLHIPIFQTPLFITPPLKFSKELLILCRSLNWRNEHCVARMSCMIMIWQFSFEIQILIYGTTERILDTSNNISYRNDLNTWGHAGPNFVAFNIRGLQLSFSTGGAKRRLSTGASA